MLSDRTHRGATTSSAEVPPETVPVYTSQFGSTQLADPRYDALDASGDIWATSGTNNHVVEFSADGIPIRTIGSEGTGNGQFKDPVGIAINKTAGDVYVSDTGGHRIEEFTVAEGTFIRAFPTTGSVHGIAIDSAGNVWVTDYQHVEKFSSTGSLLGTYGSFSLLEGIAIDSEGHIYVADWSAGVIYELSSAGVVIGHFGEKGKGNGQFEGPFGIAIDPRTRNIVVTDALDTRSQIFTSSGSYLTTFANVSGSGEGQFNGTRSLAIDSSSDLYIIDGNNHRIQKWTLSTRQTGQPGWFSLEEESNSETAFASVNVASGNLVVENEDLPPEEATANVQLDRFYNSQSLSKTGALSPRWSWGSGPDVSLNDRGESIVLSGPNGYVVSLQHQPDGTYTAPAEFEGTLTKDQNGTYTLAGDESLTIQFNTTGTMTSYSDAEGKTFTIADTTISGLNVLHTITPPSGKALEVSYDTAPHVTQSTDPAGHIRHYEFNAQKLLSTYIDPAGRKTEYGYDTNNYLNKITTPNGTVETIITTGGKVTEVTITPKGEAAYSDKFSYQAPTGPTCNTAEDAGETVVTHPPENGTPEVYCWDALGEITNYSGPAGEAEEDPNEETAGEQKELAAGTCYVDPEFPSNDCGLEDPLPENEEGNGLLQPLAPSIPDLGPTHYGIADNNRLNGFNIFTDSHFKALHVVNVRRTVPWNMVWEANHNPGTAKNIKAKEELVDYKQWVKEVKALGGKTGQPTVSFDVCKQTEFWVNPLETKKVEEIPCTTAPNKQQYEADIKEFLEAETLKEVKYFTAWNEPNNSQIAGEPKAFEAGRYWRVLDGLCAPSKHNCQVAAGEFVDFEMADANDPASKGGKYFTQYYEGMGHPTTAYRWAWHAYRDGEDTYKLRGTPSKWWKRFKNFHNAINKITKNSHKPDIWLTEQGVIYSAKGHATGALKNGNIGSSILKAYVEDGESQLTRQSHQIMRFFYYQMRGTSLASKLWDSGLLCPLSQPHCSANSPRKSYYIYQKKTPKS
jgi:YD repeat-containing protein